MRSHACLWARCGQRGKGGREGGRRERREQGESIRSTLTLRRQKKGGKAWTKGGSWHALVPSLGLIFSLGDQHLTVCSIF